MRGFRLGFSAALALLILLPVLLGLFTAPAGSFFLGYPYNTDDHMVYAAWMRQAAEGKFLFSNRFTLDPQPGLTIHLLFLVLGWISVVLGVLATTVLAQIVFAFLFVRLLDDLLERAGLDEFGRKLGLVLGTFGGGLGFLAWRTFGVAADASRSADIPFASVLRFQLPTDVWQPEGFAFPSLLTSALFAWALVLILLAARQILLVRDSKKGVALGAGAFLLIANTHSYDAALLGFVLVGFLGTAAVSRTLTGGWLARAALVVAGAIPAALWLAYVLKSDPVFQARAATPTYSAAFRPLLFGYLPLILVAVAALAPPKDESNAPRRWAGLGLYAALLLALFVLFPAPVTGFLLTPGAFAAVFLVAAGAAALSATGVPARDFFVAWAFVGLVALYFPADFQRKLAMGLAVPWGVLAAIGLQRLLLRVPDSSRRLAAAIPCLLLCATSVRWLGRQVQLIRSDVANTTVHSVFFPDDVARIASYLRPLGDRATLLAPPGIPSLSENGGYLAPILPDLNPVLVGLGGARTYAGHWSETPDYRRRRSEVTRLYFGRSAGPEALAAFAHDHGIAYAVVPHLAASDVRVFDWSGVGEEVVRGDRFSLYRLR